MPIGKGSGVAAMALALAVSGCGLLGKDEPEAPVDPCPRVDLPARDLSGALIRQPKGVGLFEVLAVDGRAKRSGAVARLHFGDYTFKARSGDDGGLDGRRGARAEPIAGLADAVDGARAFAVTWRDNGEDFAGSLAIGKPTPGSRLPTNGQVRYRGPVRLSVQAAPPAAPVAVAGTAEIDVGFGSRQVTMRFAALEPAAGGLPFEAIDWTGIGMCGPRLGSNGQGGFRTVAPGGRSVNFVGPGNGAPGGSAMINATFYGVDEAAVRPAGVAGVLLIQGDTGVISGIFAAGTAE
jgi:hypothetical protein